MEKKALISAINFLAKLTEKEKEVRDGDDAIPVDVGAGGSWFRFDGEFTTSVVFGYIVDIGSCY